MPRTTVVVIGAGQAGLAMSRCLSDRHVDHVVLERGEVAERWRRHGWDSLRLLTPNWMTRLPGFSYDGPDPDGYMATRELVTLLERYASSSRAPVVTRTTVRELDTRDSGFRVSTTRGVWDAAAVVIATGYCDLPAIPPLGRGLAPGIRQIAAPDYRSPAQLASGGVLVVGASATGVQLADEIQQSGRQVTLAVGRHTRLPRQYRGRDILWWLDRLGVLSQHVASVHDVAVSRQQPSLQLVGRPDRASLDLNVLAARGVRLTGRLEHVDKHQLHFADDLVSKTAAADVKLATVLLRIDDFIARSGFEAPAAEPFVPTWPLAGRSDVRLDMRAERIRTVIWATGYRRAYPWLRIPVVDRAGELRHQEGVTPCPGLYVLGLNFQRRRHSSFIDGVGADAAFLADHMLQTHLQKRTA